MELEFSEKNEATFIVQRDEGKKYVLFYRDPTTEERVAYSANMVKKVDGKIVDKSLENRMKYGKIIFSGFPTFREDGKTFYFTYKGKGISSDEKDPNYDPYWKELISAMCGDLLMKMAYMVFEGTLVGGDMPTILEGMVDDTKTPLE